MTNTAQDFIRFCLDYQVLKFGEFTLKSGRISPYFFNAGLLNDGVAFARLGELYAKLITEQKIEFDVLFGPAYKGIPLAVSVSVALAEKYHINKGVAFNRKEAKDHGEGGNLVGSDIKNKKVLLIDDVITAGTAVREANDILNTQNATLAGIVVSLDRQERGQGDLSAIQEIEQDWKVPVHALARLKDIIVYLEKNNAQAELSAVRTYQQEYGV